MLLNVADSLWARITKLDAFPLALVGSISAAIVGSLSYTLPTVMGILMATFFASVLLMRFFTRPQHESFIAAPAKGHWPRWVSVYFTLNKSNLDPLVKSTLTSPCLLIPRTHNHTPECRHVGMLYCHVFHSYPSPESPLCYDCLSYITVNATL